MTHAQGRVTRLEASLFGVYNIFRTFVEPERIMKINGSSTLQFLYLTTIGRVTGALREIEIWFVELEGNLYILAEHFHKAQWVRNIQQNPNVRVRLGDQQFEATARVLDEQEDAEVWQRAQVLSREKYGWGEGLPVEIQLESANVLPSPDEEIDDND